MTKETLKKANRLNDDIEMLSKVIQDKKENLNWIKISTPRVEGFFSDKFENELVDWVEKKKKEYQKELEDL